MTAARPIGTAVAFAAALAAGPTPARPAGADFPVVAHTWRPVTEHGTVIAVEVRTVLSAAPAAAAQPLRFDVPVTYAGVGGIAERTTGLTVTDGDGPVPIEVRDDPPDPGGFPSFRHFTAGRPVRYPVTISYRAMTPAEAPRAPPFGLYAAAGGVTGAGAGFLVLPEWGDSVVNRVHWDLTGLAPRARAATSFGEGDFVVRGPAGDLRQGWLMAGPLGAVASAGRGGLRAHWLGLPAFDPEAEMRWAGRMLAFLSRFYGRPVPTYRIFIRTGPAGTPASRSGTALGASFMMGAPVRPAGARPAGGAAREVIAHEMGHLFVGGIAAPAGVSSWFSEGLNTYYTRLLSRRGGFTSQAEYLAAINTDYADYFGGAARNWSADSIARVGFRDEAVRHIPYLRGSFYFADLDWRIRRRSHGRRGLDQVLRELFVRRDRGERFDHEVWRAVVEREAGPGSAAAFEAVILRGDATVVPAAEAFGQGLRREELRDAAGVVTGYRWTAAPGSR